MPCQQCGKVIMLRKSRDVTRKKFCSRSCRAQANAHRLRPQRLYGAANGNFKGGFIDKRGYHRVSVYGRETYAHRVVVDAPPGLIVHHLNGDPSDNRPENLRVMTQAEHVKEHGLSARGGKSDAT
jgi:hypothetical protein